MKPDWQHIKGLVLVESEASVRRLLEDTHRRGDTLAAVGYCFEFGIGQLCFDMCANTVRTAAGHRAAMHAKYPQMTETEIRWNSGDYDHSGAVGNWSESLWSEMERLEVLAKSEALSVVIHEEIADICSEVLATLARRGVFPDWTTIDFNVATLQDEVETVKQRNDRIHAMIRGE